MTRQDFENIYMFPTEIYKSFAPEFVEKVKQVGINSMSKEISHNDLYPVDMSGDISHDESIRDFSEYIIQTSYNLLNHQGYDLTNLGTYFQSMWMQEHYKYSSMDSHTHGFGCQIIGFYFLDVPENSSSIIFHDPRPAKIQIDLDQKDKSIVNYATSKIIIPIKSGDIIFTNAWLAHSFTKNASDNPFRFIHINISVQEHNQICETPVII